MRFPLQDEEMRDEWDEVNETSTINFYACKPISPAGIEITVSEVWDDTNGRRFVMLSCHGGTSGIQYTMDFDKAQALGLLLCSTASSMRDMAAHLDRENKNG